jgi:predicted DNA-binding transcriptional regulator AlpA
MSTSLTPTSLIEEDRVLTLDEWCAINSISRRSAYRLIEDGTGPRFIRLSARRRGVTVGENRRWQQSRVIEEA